MTSDGGFQCNICGRQNDTMPGKEDREVPSCGGCGSTIRTRSLMQALSEELFGVTIPVCDFPRLKGIRGMGTSDSEDYASLLAERFDYTNTWYHREPRFDVANISESDDGKYDFVITSEVLEHVAPPVERVFGNLFRLLKPNGVLVMTVPFIQSEATVEHFPDLHDYAIAQLSDRLVMVNRTRDGAIEVHENLVFHGGPGSTLELRLFSEKHLRECLAGGGFSEVRFFPGPEKQWGIVQAGPWSLPLAARKLAFHLDKGCTADWALQWRGGLQRVRRQEEEIASLRAVAQRTVSLDGELRERTEWAQRLDAELTEAADRIAQLQADLQQRTEWAMGLETEVTQRTDWARGLEIEIEQHERSIRALQAEAERVKRERDDARADAERLRGSRILRGMRKLGL